MQWIGEHHPGDTGEFCQERFITREDFLQLVDELSGAGSSVVSGLSNHIDSTERLISNEEWGLLISNASSSCRSAEMLSTLACAQALANRPSLSTWGNVQQIARHSWEVENWLPEAMAALATLHDKTVGSYIELARTLWSDLDQGEMKSLTPKVSQVVQEHRAYWDGSTHRLDEIWWGLRGSDVMIYEDAMRVFGLIAEFAPDDFHQLLGRSSNPFLVNAALFGGSVAAFNPRFSRWEACVRAAPLAFDPDGRWTGSVLLPLLLVHARSNLMGAMRAVPRYGADEEEVSTLSRATTELAQAVVGALAAREDAPATFGRWCSWLMRHMILRGELQFQDVRADGFVDNALLEAATSKLQSSELFGTPPADAAEWEYWSHYCVHCFMAHEGEGNGPRLEGLMSEWEISPEDWRGTKGRSLVERASLHLPREGSPNLSSHLLAVPLGSSKDLSAAWLSWWDTAYGLREVLEFGSTDVGERDYSDRSDASRLLLMLACVGVAALDQAAARLSSSHTVHRWDVAHLNEALGTAVLSILHIDDTIYREKWQQLLLNLALRRALWDERFGSPRSNGVLSIDDKPSLQEYLGNLRHEPTGLIALLCSCIRHEVSVDALRSALQAASIDLPAVVGMLERLNEVNDRRYPLNGEALRKIKPLLRPVQAGSSRTNV